MTKSALGTKTWDKNLGQKLRIGKDRKFLKIFSVDKNSGQKPGTKTWDKNPGHKLGQKPGTHSGQKPWTKPGTKTCPFPHKQYPALVRRADSILKNFKRGASSLRVEAVDDRKSTSQIDLIRGRTQNRHLIHIF